MDRSTMAPVLDRETQRIRHLSDTVAAKYDREILFWEKVLFADCRRWVCSQARGDVLEIAVGTGRNLPFYPPDIRLTGIELSESMLTIARRRAEELRRPVDFRTGDAQALEFPDRSFDTVVCTIALCTIPNDRKAIGEAKRVLRPGGRLLFFEHVRSPLLPVRLIQQMLNPFTLRFQGDYLVRDPLDYLAQTGFEIEDVERLKLGIVERVRARTA